MQGGHVRLSPKCELKKWFVGERLSDEMKTKKKKNVQVKERV